MDSLWIVLTIAVLVAVNGLFVGAEFALIRAPRTKVNQLAERGGAMARRIAGILGNPRSQDRYIVTTQLGVTSASLGLGMYGEHALAERLIPLFQGMAGIGPVVAHTVASTVALLLLTYLHVVLGEMLPKTVALSRPLRFTFVIAPFVMALRVVLFPVVAAVEWMSNRLLRAFGVNRSESGPTSFQTVRELQHIVQQSHESGLLDNESGDVLHDLFEFGELTAGDAMVPRVAISGLPVPCPPEQMLAIIEKARHTRYPVYEGDLDHIAGMVHIKDLLGLLRAQRSLTADVVRPIPFLPETARFDKVLATMRASRSHMVIVMDEHGGTAGLLTEEDLFEEVIGNIDEAAQPVRDAMHRDLWQVPGTLRLDELGEQLERDLEHDEADSVSGLVLMLLERPAEVGDAVDYEGLRFEVTEVEGHGVKECTVRRAALGGERRTP